MQHLALIVTGMTTGVTTLAAAQMVSEVVNPEWARTGVIGAVCLILSVVLGWVGHTLKWAIGVLMQVREAEIMRNDTQNAAFTKLVVDQTKQSADTTTVLAMLNNRMEHMHKRLRAIEIAVEDSIPVREALVKAEKELVELKRQLPRNT